MMGDEHDNMLNIEAGEDDLKLDGDGDNLPDYDTRSEASRIGSSISNKSASQSPPRQSKAKTSRGHQYDYITKLNYLFRDTRFFVIKSNNEENIDLSKARGVWSTLPANESKLNQAYEECRNVLLVFSGKETGKFAGFARLADRSRRDVSPVPWVLPPGMSARNLSSVFAVDWICRKDLPFAATTHLLNQWNDMKPIKIGRDGQEMEPKAAEALLRLFPEDDGIDMTPILRKSKLAAHKTKMRSGKMEDRRRYSEAPRRSDARPVMPRSRFRLPSIRNNSTAHSHLPRMRHAEEMAYMHGLPPLPFGPPGMYPPSGFQPMAMMPPPLPRYYDGVPNISSLMHPTTFSAAFQKKAYDYSVDEFIQRTRRRRSRSMSRERVRERNRHYMRGKRTRSRSRTPVKANGRAHDRRARDDRDRGRSRERQRDHYRRRSRPRSRSRSAPRGGRRNNRAR